MDSLKKAVSAGITPFELQYYPMVSLHRILTPSYLLRLQINHPQHGALLPEQYQAIANRDIRSVRLFRKLLQLSIHDLNLFMDRNEPVNLILPVPKRLLPKGELLGYLKEIPRFSSRYADMLTLAFGPDLLLEDTEPTVMALQALKAAGVHLMMTDFGSSYCPIYRILELPFDSVVLTPEVAKEFDTLDSIVLKNLISFLHDLHMEIHTEGLWTEEHFRNAQLYGVVSYRAAKPSTPSFLLTEGEVIP